MSDTNPNAQEGNIDPFKNLDPQNLAKEIVAALQQADHSRLWVDREQHAEDHKFIRALVEREKRREERKDRIKERLIGTGIVSVIMAGLGYVGKWGIEMFNHYIIHVAANGQK